MASWTSKIFKDDANSPILSPLRNLGKKENDQTENSSTTLPTSLASAGQAAGASDNPATPTSTIPDTPPPARSGSFWRSFQRESSVVNKRDASPNKESFFQKFDSWKERSNSTLFDNFNKKEGQHQNLNDPHHKKLTQTSIPEQGKQNQPISGSNSGVTYQKATPYLLDFSTKTIAPENIAFSQFLKINFNLVKKSENPDREISSDSDLELDICPKPRLAEKVPEATYLPESNVESGSELGNLGLAKQDSSCQATNQNNHKIPRKRYKKLKFYQPNSYHYNYLKFQNEFTCSNIKNYIKNTYLNICHLKNLIQILNSHDLLNSSAQATGSAVTVHNLANQNSKIELINARQISDLDKILKEKSESMVRLQREHNSSVLKFVDLENQILNLKNNYQNLQKAHSKLVNSHEYLRHGFEFWEIFRVLRSLARHNSESEKFLAKRALPRCFFDSNAPHHLL